MGLLNGVSGLGVLGFRVLGLGFKVYGFGFGVARSLEAARFRADGGGGWEAQVLKQTEPQRLKPSEALVTGPAKLNKHFGAQ